MCAWCGGFYLQLRAIRKLQSSSETPHDGECVQPLDVVAAERASLCVGDEPREEITRLLDVVALEQDHLRLQAEPRVDLKLLVRRVEALTNGLNFGGRACLEPSVEDRHPVERGRAHEHHAVARHGGGRRVVDLCERERRTK